MITTRRFETLGLDDKQHSRRHRQTYNFRIPHPTTAPAVKASRNLKIWVIEARNHNINILIQDEVE
jgi:hypothetical protein